jgi:hypothetical protein
LGVDAPASRVAGRFLDNITLNKETPNGVAHSTDIWRASAREIERILRAQLGVMLRLRFRPALGGMPNAIAWEALDERAELVTGKLVLHAGVRYDEVVSWAELTVDGYPEVRGGRPVFGGADPDLRLRHVERLTRDLMKRIEDDPHGLAIVDLVSALAEIANEAKTRL